MPSLWWRQRSLWRGDEEADPSTPATNGSVKVDLSDSDDRWVIDVNIDNIITKIVSPSGSRLGDGEDEIEQASYTKSIMTLWDIYRSSNL